MTIVLDYTQGRAMLCAHQVIVFASRVHSAVTHRTNCALTRTVATADGEPSRQLTVSCMHGAFWIATAGGNDAAGCESHYRLRRRS